MDWNHFVRKARLCGLVVALLARSAWGEGIVLDAVAAHVNETVITVGDVLGVLESARRQLVHRYSGAELRTKLQEACADAVESLVERRLILDAYDKQDGRIPDWVVEKRVNEIVRDMFSDDRSRLIEALAEDRRTFEEWKEDVRSSLVVSSMISASVEQKIRIPASAVRTVYEETLDDLRVPEQVKLRMIEMAKAGSPDEQGVARADAEAVRKRLVDGAVFAETARRVSGGPRAAEGGDWGWIEPAKMLRSELLEAVTSLSVQEISPLVETEDAFYILMVEGRKAAGIPPLEDVAPQIERELRHQERERIHAEWIEELKKDAYVKVFDLDLF